MLVKHIKTLPEKFVFKSRINSLCSNVVYTAEKIAAGYKITWDINGIVTETMSTHDFNRHLLNNEFILV